MSYEKISISLPAKILAQIDRYAEAWMTSRSGAIVRIVQEWLESQPISISTPYHLGTGPSDSPHWGAGGAAIEDEPEVQAA